MMKLSTNQHHLVMKITIKLKLIKINKINYDFFHSKFQKNKKLNKIYKIR